MSIVPKHKFDNEALENASSEEIIRYRYELLEWMQDINWPVSKAVYETLKPYVHEIEDALVFILEESNDLEWKVNIIRSFGGTREENIPECILSYMEKVIANKENEWDCLVEACEDTLYGQ